MIGVELREEIIDHVGIREINFLGLPRCLGLENAMLGYGFQVLLKRVDPEILEGSKIVILVIRLRHQEAGRLGEGVDLQERRDLVVDEVIEALFDTARAMAPWYFELRPLVKKTVTECPLSPTSTSSTWSTLKNVCDFGYVMKSRSITVPLFGVVRSTSVWLG